MLHLRLPPALPRPASATAAALSFALAGACGPPAVPPLVAPPVEPAKPPPPPASSLPPARWVRVGAASVPGPWSAAGALGIVAGRRVLVAANGSARVETVPSPEPLSRLILVPLPGEARLVGLGSTTLYRFDDPLGEGKPLLTGVGAECALGAMPGLVVVRCKEGTRFVDVDTGQLHARPAALPDFPLLNMIFTGAREGAALFSVRGLMVTRDGGGSWQVPRSPSGAEEGLSLAELGQDARGVYAVSATGKVTSRIDVAHGSFGRAPAVAADGRERLADSALAKLVESSEALRQAVSSGVETPDGGGAWFVQRGRALQIDLHTEAVSTAAESPHLGCGTDEVYRAGDTVWFGCTTKVVRGTIAADGIELGEPESTGIASGILRVSPSGGALQVAAELRPGASAGAPRTVAVAGTQVSVRQPDGKWQRANAWSNAGPLADGTFAFVPEPTDGEMPRVVLMSPASHVMEASPPLELPGFRGIVTPIEEGLDHVLRFVAADGAGLVAVSQPPGKDARLTRLPGATRVRLRAGRGIALGASTLLATTDGGETWTEVAAPPGALAAANADEEAFAVSSAGARLGDYLRIGWGPSEAPHAPGPTPASLADANAPDDAAAGKPHALACRDDGPSPGTALPPDRAAVRALLGNLPADVPVFFTDLGPIAAFVEVMAPQVPRGNHWAVSWIDPFETGGRPHIWSGAPTMPASQAKGFAGGTALVTAAVQGNRALFGLRLPDPAAAGEGHETEPPTMLLRINADGQFAVAATTTTPGGLEAGSAEGATPGETPDRGLDAAFGSGPGAPIAWIERGLLQVWADAGPPHPIARLAGIRSPVAVGEPTKDGVPLLVYDGDWAALRTVPLSGGRAALSPEGWTRLGTPFLPDRLPTCDATAAGARFRVRAIHHGPAEVGTTRDEKGAPALWDVRVTGTAACVAGVSRKVGDTFVRVDLTGARGEGGKAALSKLACGWVPVP